MPYDPTSVVAEEDKYQASFLASETLHHVRSSLDFLVYNASWFAQGTPQKQTQYPILDEANQWSSPDTARRLGGIPQHQTEWIESTQPFNDVGWTADLRDLSNADKHRTGIEVSPTVQFEIDLPSVHSHPDVPGLQRAAIKTVSLHFLLPTLDPPKEIHQVFGPILAGSAKLTNLFLREAEMPLLQVSGHIAASARPD